MQAHGLPAAVLWGSATLLAATLAGCSSAPPPHPAATAKPVAAQAAPPEAAKAADAAAKAESMAALAPAPEPPAEAASVEPAELPPGGTEDEPEVPPETTETPDAPAEDSGAILHEALDAYESADVFWRQGSLDDAFAALDRAYELMARVPPDDDPALLQEKDNLRRLISRRLVEIYASRQTAVGHLDRSIPLPMNDDVKREIASFQGSEREFFLKAYRRSGLYRPLILAELRKAGLPDQLSWLPLVESGFSSRAFSRARALGLWQFIASTGCATTSTAPTGSTTAWTRPVRRPRPSPTSPTCTSCSATG